MRYIVTTMTAGMRDRYVFSNIDQNLLKGVLHVLPKGDEDAILIPREPFFIIDDVPELEIGDKGSRLSMDEADGLREIDKLPVYQWNELRMLAAME